MSFDEIAQNVTTMGYVAAVIGVLLCVAVLMIRFRARNLVLEKERAERMQNIGDEKNSSVNADDMKAEQPQAKSTFKTFVPENASE